MFVDTMTNKEYLQIANMPIFWAMVIPTVLAMCWQAASFIKTAVNAGPLVGLSKEDSKIAIRAGVLSSFGPGLSMFTVTVAFMAIMGGPFAWLRLSIIGTIVTETLGATAGATALGMNLGGPEYGIIGWANSVWVITLNTWGFFIVDLLFFHKIESLKGVIDRIDGKMFDYVGLCVMIGCIAKFTSGQMVGGLAKITAGVAGFIIMLLILKISEKAPKVKEFALGVSMLLAIFLAQAVKVMMG